LEALLPEFPRSPSRTRVLLTEALDGLRGNRRTFAFDAAFSGDFAPARLPGRFPVGFHDAAGDRPARLIGRLQDEQPAGPVDNQRPGRNRDRRNSRNLPIASAGHNITLRPVDRSGPRTARQDNHHSRPGQVPAGRSGIGTASGMTG